MIKTIVNRDYIKYIKWIANSSLTIALVRTLDLPIFENFQLALN